MVFELLERGSDRGYIGEQISQLEHALQATLFAVQSKADDETVIASLLHDIGQFCSASELNQMLVDAFDINNDNAADSQDSKPSNKKSVSVGVMGHEKLGSDYLSKLGFSKKVCDLVESHVVAKRYLTAVDPNYYAGLSNASKQSLKFQGGPFSEEEVSIFESDPLFKQKVQLRKWDDASKVVGLQTPGLEAYRKMAVNHLSSQNGNMV
ncbi:hypothetical protein J3B02_003582 [Coemansia erecta]|uniref:HD domain-containing protein n=1 Tax=Coemansia asiatica TaxID=1052880 RepID=A0A9W7XGT8_9FUNG|nr:hypothetical protein LPJ64_005228 [Coemansia asiatica]KAJ2851273.1 hypothetical protein J3B02_003582 [Coemansia erecta]KAJ2879054.1 hypothetical protein FB639_003191 [Coemansia asiatica]